MSVEEVLHNLHVTIGHLEHVLQETNSTQTLWEYQQHL